MGIQGLLPLLKSIMVPIHVKELDGGCRVAVDTYSWLHKGALSCSKDLCNQCPTTRHIDYCMHRVNLLRYHGVHPILVFDGDHLPIKAEEEAKRARLRKLNLERAIEHDANCNSAAAYECYQKAIDISPSIAYQLIQVLKSENVDYIVAPYEADAQMTFLALTNQVDAVITEDSDLIPFGCPRIIFKMDKFGNALQFQQSMLHLNKDLNLTGFTNDMLLYMCIFSGCDYLHSLPGMGLKTAHALIHKFKTYDKVIKHLRYNAVTVPPLYEESFNKALWAFLHQRVYDPITQHIVHLTDIPYHLAHNLDFLGPSMPQDLAKGIAKGDINPITKLPFQVGDVHSELVVDKIYLLKDFTPNRERKQLDLPAQKNVLTNYFCSASLEAKRKFKAPRVILKPLDLLEGSSPISEAPESEERTNSKYSNSILLDSGTMTEYSPKDSIEDGFAIDGSQTFESTDGSVRSSDRAVPLELSKHAVYKPCPTLHKKHEDKFMSDGVGGKTRSVNKKVIVRSSYFKHKLSNENDLVNKNENLLSPESGVLCENTITRSASFEIDELKSSTKRKSIFTERTESETVKVKHDGSDTSLTNESIHVDNKLMEMGDREGNFGCNISHLKYYSDVAEKSMEKFVSVISSFRCTSSGTRASGLRAPLKDVRNMLGTGLTITPMDISKFSYKASNQKTASVTLRN